MPSTPPKRRKRSSNSAILIDMDASGSTALYIPSPNDCSRALDRLRVSFASSALVILKDFRNVTTSCLLAASSCSHSRFCCALQASSSSSSAVSSCKVVTNAASCWARQTVTSSSCSNSLKSRSSSTRRPCNHLMLDKASVTSPFSSSCASASRTRSVWHVFKASWTSNCNLCCSSCKSFSCKSFASSKPANSCSVTSCAWKVISAATISTESLRSTSSARMSAQPASHARCSV
mmetsp:Transcript_129624/g.258630  ORF Transcript_129624/g.258630 Transcript_129624/m.258630 type:complete len:234 (-) Transcript_129624:599-1300(-)